MTYRAISHAHTCRLTQMTSSMGSSAPGLFAPQGGSVPGINIQRGPARRGLVSADKFIAAYLSPEGLFFLARRRLWSSWARCIREVVIMRGMRLLRTCHVVASPCTMTFEFHKKRWATGLVLQHQLTNTTFWRSAFDSPSIPSFRISPAPQKYAHILLFDSFCR